MNIDKILTNNGLTIHKGCFNCKKLKDCWRRNFYKNKEGLKADYMEIHYGKNKIPYRAGCCCSGYETDKERVEFT